MGLNPKVPGLTAASPLKAVALPPLAAKTKQPGFARGNAPLLVLSPRESVSLGSQVALLPYEPSSLATLFRGGE